MARNAFLTRFGFQHPIIQGPMAGGPSTPELAAAVSNAGGMGSLGAAYLTPDAIRDSIRRTRALTSGPFNVNLFAGGHEHFLPVDPEPMLSLLAGIHAELGLAPPVLPDTPPDPFPEQLEVVLEERPPIFSFTFGIPGADAMRRLRARGIAIFGTATTVDEARMLAEAGVDAIVAQGAEAGAHRGTFSVPFDAAMVPLDRLVREIVAAVQMPVIAAGGLMDGRDVARVLGLGAAAALLGTAFLACPESGASEAYKRAILNATANTTVITRAFSGRPARGLSNRFISMLSGRESAILAYPLQNALTRPMRTAAAQRGDSGLLSLWAGQGVARARALPAAELVRLLVEEARQD